MSHRTLNRARNELKSYKSKLNAFHWTFAVLLLITYDGVGWKSGEKTAISIKTFYHVLFHGFKIKRANILVNLEQYLAHGKYM